MSHHRAARVIAIAIIGALALGAAADAQQTATPTTRTREITPATRAVADRAMDYAADAIALQRMLSCPSTRDGGQRAAISRRIVQMRDAFMKAESDPYWHGYADSMISRALTEGALAMAADINARRPPDAWARQCADAAARLSQILLR